MSKLFFEVFPSLTVKDDMRKLLAETEITKVSADRSKTSIRIYLFATRLIYKKQIFFLEREIARQLFPNRPMAIKIIETFRLSGQYTAKRLLDAYGESIADELKNYSILLYNIYRKADLSFEGESRMHLRLEDTLVAKEHSEELIGILEKIFCERCGMDCSIQLSFEPSTKSGRIQNADFAIEQEIRQVVRLLGRKTIRPHPPGTNSRRRMRNENRQKQSGSSKNHRKKDRFHPAVRTWSMAGILMRSAYPSKPLQERSGKL